jgi:trk system potassium uptake protein
MNNLKNTIIKVTNVLSGLVCLGTGLILILELGFNLSYQNQQQFTNIHIFYFGFFITDYAIRSIFQTDRMRYWITHPTDLFIFLPYINQLIPDATLFPSFFISQISLLVILLGRFTHITALLRILRFNPTQILLTAFLFAIFIGSLVLCLPISTTIPEGIPFTDAIFTATSAVCVTGLVTKDISVVFSPFGQTVILILFQIGGLGIMAISALLAIFLNKRFSQRESLEVQKNYSTSDSAHSFQIIFAIFKYTLLFEFLGTCLLMVSWYPNFESLEIALFYSIFHAISAFCNAGFSLFSDSLTNYATHFPVIMTISSLIIVGGLGFPVIFNLFHHNLWIKKNPKTFYFTSLRLQTKLAIRMTIILIVVGTAAIFIGEFNNALKDFNIGDKILVSFFQSVTARTAGFNTVDLGLFSHGTLLFLILLMFVGASPGSTGGGIKTTTFGILIASFWANLKIKDKTTIFKRTVTHHNEAKALAIVILSAIIINLFLYLLLVVEQKDFVKILFETVSAFGTVGLSLGLTGQLSIGGKVIIMVLMFIGRVGPLTVAFALSKPKPKINYAYPEENILIT